MIRRNFIRVMAGGCCFAAMPPGVSSCSGAGDPEKKRRDVNQALVDIRLRIISLAMTAPNSHNIQPWKIVLSGKDSFLLYVDQERLLSDTDPFARQIHSSQGTFLEMVRIVAPEFGYTTNIEYFPEGEYGNQDIEDRPVARVSFKKDAAVAKNSLFNQISFRQTNKRTFDRQPIPVPDFTKLRQLADERSIQLIISSESDIMSSLPELAKAGMDIERKGPGRQAELARMFRFSEEEARLKKDGFSVANSGMTGIKRWFVETLFLGDRESASKTDSSFANQSVDLTFQQAASASAFGWLYSGSNRRVDQVEAGELYCRLNLKASELGIAIHPMNQLTEEYADMRETKQRFQKLIGLPDKTIMMLFRLGYAESTPFSKRRSVGDVLVST